LIVRRGRKTFRRVEEAAHARAMGYQPVLLLGSPL